MLSFRLAVPAAGPTGMVVALHGLMESSSCLEAAFPAWTAQGLVVLAVDLRGHGKSPRWTPEQLNKHPGDVMVEDIAAVLAAPELRQFGSLPLIFYGHSAGGGIAAAVAAEIAEAAAAGQDSRTVAGVLLEDPFWRLPVTRLQDPEVAAAAYAALTNAQAMSPQERFELKKSEWPLWDDAEISGACQAQADADRQLVRNGNVIPTRPWPELLEALRSAAVPVLIITGTVRTGITAAHQEIARAKGARVEVFQDASHFIRRDATHRFMNTASAFFEDCGRAVPHRVS